MPAKAPVSAVKRIVWGFAGLLAFFAMILKDKSDWSIHLPFMAFLAVAYWIVAGIVLAALKSGLIGAAKDQFTPPKSEAQRLPVEPSAKLVAAYGGFEVLDVNGLPVWQGQDSIYNMAKEEVGGRMNAAAGGFIGLAVAFGAFSLLVVAVVGMRGGMGGVFVLLALIAGAGLFFFSKSQTQPEWLGKPWKLSANESGLEYRKGGAGWAVAYDNISRVEVSPTTKWERVRRYPMPITGKETDPLPIPDVEMQVFLFLNDGSRRVIHTANAALEDCTVLSGSVREWLGRQQAAAAPVAAAVPSTPSGFDL